VPIGLNCTAPFNGRGGRVLPSLPENGVVDNFVCRGFQIEADSSVSERKSEL